MNLLHLLVAFTCIVSSSDSGVSWDCETQFCLTEAVACQANSGCVDLQVCVKLCVLGGGSQCIQGCRGSTEADSTAFNLFRPLFACASVRPQPACYRQSEPASTSPALTAAPTTLPAPGAELKDIPYGTDTRNVFDLYLTTASGPNPLFIWIHGGGWLGGSKDRVNDNFLALRERGYSVASISYRLSEFDYPIPMLDVKAAIRYIRANAATYDIDPNRFIVSGSSAGGHLAAFLGTSIGVAEFEDSSLGNAGVSSAVQLVVDFYGPSDILTMDDDAQINLCANPLVHDAEGTPEAQLLDCVPSACPDRANAASPIFHVDGNEPPFLIFHGAEDCTVATPQGERLHQALLTEGIESEHYVVDGAGHSLSQILAHSENVARLYDFIDRHMMPPAVTDPTPTAGNGPIYQDIAYSTVHERNVLDLYLTSAAGPNPLLIWVHGGGWRAGNKEQVNDQFLALRERGYSIASINYRYSSMAEYPAPVTDVKAAIRWLRANADTYDLDPTRFIAAGTSAGGHLVNMLGTTANDPKFEDSSLGNAGVSSAVQLVVNFYGSTNFVTLQADADAVGCPDNVSNGREPLEEFLHCPDYLGAECAPRMAEQSPVLYVNGQEPPFIHVQGAEDCTVPVNQARQLHQALIGAGGESTLLEVQGAGHSLAQVLTDENYIKVVEFIDYHMMGARRTLVQSGTTVGRLLRLAQ